MGSKDPWVSNDRHAVAVNQSSSSELILVEKIPAPNGENFSYEAVAGLKQNTCQLLTTGQIAGLQEESSRYVEKYMEWHE
jgi:hypothetical protein